MASNIANSFITQWGTEIKLAYQERKGKLRQAVKTVNNVTGSTHKFHTMGTVTANSKTRGADLTFLNPDQSVATATLSDKYAGILVNDLDEAKTNADVRRGYIETGAASLARAEDEIIVSAWDASYTDITTTTGDFTYARLIEALTVLNENEVEPEDRYLVIGPQQVAAALQISTLTSADYMTLKAVQMGEFGTALGFKWIMSNRLSLSGSPAGPRDCYAVAKSASGLAIGRDVMTRIDYDPVKAEHVVLSKMSMGATTIEAGGVVRINCND